MFFPSEKINLHTHSNYCDHAVGGIEDYVASALSSGLEVIGFTEHAPVAGDPISCNMMMHSLPSYVKDVRTAGDSAALFIQGKGHEEKTDYVKLAAPVEKVLRDYLTDRGETDGKAPLFVSDSNNSRGSRITTRSVSRLVKNHMRAAGYDSERLTAHSLRHTAATLNLLNGATLEETRQLLRHTSINTTLIYSHALERAANNSEARIAAAVF